MVHDHDLVAIQETRAKVQKAHAAWLKYAAFSQEQVNAVVERMAAAGRANARRLAELAVEETGYGNVADKITKNLLCSDLLAKAIRNMRTVGLIRELPDDKVVEYAVPVGVVAAIAPTTNPTSTVIYKSLISLKSGNAVVISPHPRAKNCTREAADLMHAAAVEAGAPEGIVQCLEHVSLDATQALMRHEKTGVILATGGHGLVKAAYSSGKPAYGVSPGNVPALIEKTADVADAVAKVVAGKSFDYGTVCSSEQAIVTCNALREPVLAELKKQKAYLCSQAEADALAKLLVQPSGAINPKCVGQAPEKLAQWAGFSVPAGTTILAAEVTGVGRQYPLSTEKLSPVLALYFVADFAAAMDTCEAILRFMGLGHTCVIHSKDDARIRQFAQRMPANRVLANTSGPPGSVGITTNLLPSMTLGCGAAAGNSTSDNVGPLHLIDIKRLAYAVRTPEEALPPVETIAREAAKTSTQVPIAIPAHAAGSVRDAIAAAVEEYLTKRAAKSTATAPAPAKPATRAALGASEIAAQVVDSFLATRRSITQPPVCGMPVPASPASPPAAPAPPEPQVVIADFVCEADVRVAMGSNRKIYIGPKTIVTPAARELAGQHDILVVAERP